MNSARSVRIGGSGLFGALLVATGVAAAHVEYVTTTGERGDPLAFLATALSNPTVVAVLAASGVAVVGATVAYLRVRPLAADVRVLRAALADYRDLVPWLLRLSIGLPMVGAGYTGYLFTPLVTASETAVPARLFGVAVGFLLLFGLATRFVAGVALCTYLAVLVAHPEAFFAVEYAAGLLAVVVVGGGRPSADHVIRRMASNDETVYSRIDPLYRTVAVPVGRRLDAYRAFVPTVVRVGMGVAFVYLALAEKLLVPARALAVVAKYDLTAVLAVPPELWVLGAALTELLLGVLLVVGLFTRAASGAAFVVFTTTLFGLPDDPVLAHVSLFGLVSVLLVTGAGPVALDGWLARNDSANGADRADEATARPAD